MPESNDVQFRLALVLGFIPQVAAYVRESFFRTLQVTLKDANIGDPVTEVDINTQRIILKKIVTACPNDGVLAEEENTDTRANQQYVWLIDPIDGTTNFSRRNPGFVISIACFDTTKQDFILGVIAMPITGEIFYATRGNGSFLLDRSGKNRISIDTHLTTVDQSIASIGYYSRAVDGKAEGIPLINRFAWRVNKLRVEGSVAFSLTHLAWGKLGIASFNTNIWDMAAGIILVEEAGGIVTDQLGNPIRSLPAQRVRIIAATPLLHRKSLAIAQSAVLQ